MKRLLFITLLAIALPLQAAQPDPREIMRQVNDRDDGVSSYSRSVVATCRYQTSGGRMRCAEQPRIKVMEGVQKDFGNNGKDSRSINIILQPAAEKGIGFLQYDYDAPGKDSDQWMYLSALGKVKRLVSGNDDEPKSGTMFGSEIAYEDVERPHLDDYRYKLLREENYQGRPCWVIESVPTPARARKSNYSRSVSWIDKERLIMLQAQIYDRTGRPIKHITTAGVEKVSGVWVTRMMNVNNIQSRRITTMKTEEIVINPKVNNELFSLRTLTDGAYREQQLTELRKGLQ
jgi:outer membrane lipoprotein-sorting protein